MQTVARAAVQPIRRIAGVKLASLPSKGPVLKLQLEKDGILNVPLVWLRDHSREPFAYNSGTNQRRSRALDLFEKAVVNSDESIKFDENKQTINIEWKDGNRSSFAADDLLTWAIKDRKLKAKDLHHLWNGENLKELPTLSKKNFCFEHFVELFTQFGFVTVTDVDPVAQATEEFCREDTYHEDTAYGNEEIGPHNDGTYFGKSPGIQVLHCLRPADEGGLSVLVDGFYVAETLRQKDPKAFKLLSTMLVEHHYLEGGSEGNKIYSVSRHHPIICTSKDGQIIQTRFNPYDRAPLRSLCVDDDESTEKTFAFYRAYEQLSRMMHDPANAVTFGLKPGTVLFFDNFRTLHARTAFKGYRQMCGCYLSRENFFAKARPFLSRELRRFY